MKQCDLKLYSQRLAYILRHSKTVERQFGGWVNMSDVMNQTGYQADIIKEIVRMDKKGRFEIDETNNCIRALYGHSVKVDMGYKEVEPPSTLMHGTTPDAAQHILSDGLSSRSRQFVHLTDDMDIAISTGKRHGDDTTVLCVDAEMMHKDGFKFYNPAPHIWLVSSVPAQYYLQPFGNIFEEINEDLFKRKSVCIIDLDPHRVNILKLNKIAEYSDCYHISDYEAKDWYTLTMVFVNEYDDWKRWQSSIEKIKAETPNFILFYTYDVQEELNIGIPYIKTTMHYEAILRIMNFILFEGNPLPIDYFDFCTWVLRGDKNGVLTSFNVFDANKNNRFLDYFKDLNIDKCNELLIHFTLPTRAGDTAQFSACIKDLITAVPENIKCIWGYSYADTWDLGVSIFEK